MRLLLVCLFIAIALLVPSKSSSDDVKHSTAEKLRNLDQMSTADSESLLQEIENEWQTTKEVLITNLSSKQDQTRFVAAYLLGLYRYAQAAASLANVITMEAKDSTQRQREARWGQYPAVEALIQIGKPSVQAMLQNLESSNDEHIRQLSAKVIHYVEGPELARIVVTNAVAKQSDSTKKANLESSLRYFEQQDKK